VPKKNNQNTKKVKAIARLKGRKDCGVKIINKLNQGKINKAKTLQL
jgi:hypothetical protein